MVDAAPPFAYDFQPPVGFHFLVEFDLDDAGEQDTRFREVSGLNMELGQETHNEGGENRFAHKLPMPASYGDLSLKRGKMADSAVIAWIRDAVQNFDIRPTTVWVKLLNDAHEPLETYTFVNAWPKKWSIADFNAETSEFVVETLELSYSYYGVA